MSSEKYLSIAKFIALNTSAESKDNYSPRYKLTLRNYKIPKNATTSHIKSSINTKSKINIDEIKKWKKNLKNPNARKNTKDIFISLPDLNLNELVEYHKELIGVSIQHKYSNGLDGFQHHENKIKANDNEEYDKIKTNFISGINAVFDRPEEIKTTQTQQEEKMETSDDVPKVIYSNLNPIQIVIKACFVALLAPLVNILKKLIKQNNTIVQQNEDISGSLDLIIHKMQPVKKTRLRHYFQQDLEKIVESFATEIIDLKTEIYQLKRELRQHKTSNTNDNIEEPYTPHRNKNRKRPRRAKSTSKLGPKSKKRKDNSGFAIDP